MTSYLVPTGFGVDELTEKRSRFIGHVWPVETEDEAKEKIAQVKQQHYDARHNCWCYIIRAGGVLRYSDDGEPQATAGMPMLEMFRREKIDNVCCVVTRYFGGVLLGTGGLSRAYSQAAKIALEVAGVSIMSLWKTVAFSSTYPLLERLKKEVEAFEGKIKDIEYGENVSIFAQVPEPLTESFQDRIKDISSGTITTEIIGEEFISSPRI